MSRWFRAYDDALDDPKVQRLPDNLFRAWFNLMCVTSKNGGKPFSLDEIAFRLRVTEAKAKIIADALVKAGLLDGTIGLYVSHNWDKRQFKSDTSNDRVKRFRDRDKKQGCNVTDAVTETPPETEQNRTEHSRACTPAADLSVAIRKAFENAGSPNIPDSSRVDLWLSQGYDAAIILATVTTIVRKNPAISTLNYFDSAIREAHEKRAPKIEKSKPIDWEKWVAMHARGSPWPHTLGPEPGYDGCKAPREVLEKYGYLKLQAAE